MSRFAHLALLAVSGTLPVHARTSDRRATKPRYQKDRWVRVSRDWYGRYLKIDA